MMIITEPTAFVACEWESVWAEPHNSPKSRERTAEDLRNFVQNYLHLIVKSTVWPLVRINWVMLHQCTELDEASIGIIHKSSPDHPTLKLKGVVIIGLINRPPPTLPGG